MAKGGKREGAGRPKGSEEQSTIEKREMRAFIREKVRARQSELVDAQLDNAIGVYVMSIRNEDGTFTVADTEEQIRAGLAVSGSSLVRIYARQPNQPSGATMLAYAADKPVEPVEVSGEGGGPLVVKWEADK